jgi:flagellar biosynthesis chaperone FliJ
MIAGMFMGNSLCKNVNEAVKEKTLRLEMEHRAQYIDALETGIITEIPEIDVSQHLTVVESICKGQQAYLG